jgi:hypothetical protein
MITVNFRTQSGINTSRRFEKNQGVSIYGNIQGIFLPDLFAYVRLEIIDQFNNTILFDDKFANIFGDYDFWFRTSNNNENLKIKISAKHPGGNVETVIVPIAIGSNTPENLPDVPVSINLFDYLPIALIGIAGFFIYKQLK